MLNDQMHTYGKNWYKEISSWRCGEGVEMRLYRGDQYDDAVPHSSNRLPPQDVIDQIWIRAVDLDCKGTACPSRSLLFDDERCVG